MKPFSHAFVLACACLALAAGTGSRAFAQFDLDAYHSFLLQTSDISAAALQDRYPAGRFLESAGISFATAAYADTMAEFFRLTPDEIALLDRHGFVVTDRLREGSFAEAFLIVYQRDLPVFVSTDAILHAIHMSYDKILMDLEGSVLGPKLEALLTAMHTHMSTLEENYGSEPAMRPMLRDVDMYLTIPRILLGHGNSPFYAENWPHVRQLLQYIKGATPRDDTLFSSIARTIDFSQFTPRGHYTRSEYLQRYFQAMIWLGRTELYLSAPKSQGPPVPEKDIQRQTIDAALLYETVQATAAAQLLDEMDTTIRALVGEPDNVTVPQLGEVLQAAGIQNTRALLDRKAWKAFQETLLGQEFASQRILSQLLVSDPRRPGQVQPASAFLLLGQRFVIDSYVFSNVVFDRILYNGMKVRRMLPSSLDVLFALGNNAAAQLLSPQLEQYHYAPNLAAVRFLIDAYADAFWSSSFYNGWLQAIRALNPPANRMDLPKFMQTAAWWQEKMTTQLAAWAQLRHDNLLYAKQSYSGVAACSFPASYVEPIPEFYRAVRRLAAKAGFTFSALQFDNDLIRDFIVNYFQRVQSICDTLATIAEQELQGMACSDAQRAFLQRMLFDRDTGCAPDFGGWYADLYYAGNDDMTTADMVIADVHTAPTDANGNPVGWVLHVATGPANMGFVVADLPERGPVVFAGPVLSYYEHVSTNFQRLTDDEWQELYRQAPPLRPEFTDLYLADKNGNARLQAVSLTTGVRTPDLIPASHPATQALVRNYPNPFNSATIIFFEIPPARAPAYVELSVQNVAGKEVKRLLAQKLPAGRYTARWDGLAGNNLPVASGVYYCTLKIDGRLRQITKMTLLK